MAVRMTVPVRRVVRALLDAKITSDDDPLYGREIAEAAGVSLGSIYPILARLDRAGWLEGHWEYNHSPPRRYYHFTPSGEVAARRALAKTAYGKLWSVP